MLFEKNTYLDDFPINIRIANIQEYPFHYHHDTEFIYVLQGEISLKNVCHNYILKEGDIFTNSGHEIHCLKGITSDNIVAIIQVSNRFFTQYFPDLPKSCFMTYTKNDKHLKMDNLRKMLLNILLDYSRKSFNYKNCCINQMIEAIKYINQHFNLFAFDKNVVVNFNSNNPIIVDRISRIINYIYANHSEKITLEDLSEEEHLSSYYISHLIKDYIGLNFQEFLCFARVEMSEILLLETDKKISTISKEIGFSKTSYYEKFFTKWFRMPPEEYRKKNTPYILNSKNPAKLEILSDNRAVDIIRKKVSALNDQEKSNNKVNQLHLKIDINPNEPPIMNISHNLEVIITPNDFQKMGDKLLTTISELNASKIILMANKGDDESSISLIANILKYNGYNAAISCKNHIEYPHSAGYDSIAEAIHIFRTYFISNHNITQCYLRDQGDSEILLKGLKSCITSAQIFKPSFYAYKFLSNIKGQLIYWGKYYYVIKNSNSSNSSYILITLNYNDEIQNLCFRNSTVYETKEILNAFKDELNVDFNIPVSPGRYVIAKFALSNLNSIFNHIAELNFPSKLNIPKYLINMLNTAPQSQISIENFETVVHITSVIKGVGLEIIFIEKCD